MPVEAVGIEFGVGEGQLSVDRLTEQINRILETGRYVGHIAVPGVTHSTFDNRVNGEFTRGIILLVDKPEAQFSR